MFGRKKTTARWFFLSNKNITWKLPELQVQQRVQQMRQQQVQQPREQEPRRGQRLLLFYRKQREQQQR
jgi:hypothetical protein